eukprot:2070022-Rhodomonas_salina.1
MPASGLTVESGCSACFRSSGIAYHAKRMNEQRSTRHAALRSSHFNHTGHVPDVSHLDCGQRRILVAVS